MFFNFSVDDYFYIFNFFCNGGFFIFNWVDVGSKIIILYEDIFEFLEGGCCVVLKGNVYDWMIGDFIGAIIVWFFEVGLGGELELCS